VSQVLYDGGRSKLGRDSVGIAIEISEQAARLARQNAVFDAANSYLGVLKAESLLQTVLLTQRQAEQHLKDAQLREHTGAGSQFELLQAQTALINVQGQVIQARNAVKLARLSLGTFIHQRLGSRGLDQTPVLPTVAADEATIERGIENRPEVEISKRQIKLDALGSEISARDALPVAAVQGILVGRGMSLPAYVVMGSLNWTLFDGGKTLSKVRQGEKSVEADRANLTGLREGLRLEVEKAIADRDEAREHIVMTEQGLKMAKTSYELALIRYSGGAGSGTEVIDAMTIVSQAQAGYIQATYEKLGAELRLAKALGLDLAQLLS
ncbi:MAG TPA: TolC family protein, partial [Chroococcales cyanobacterium]